MKIRINPNDAGNPPGKLAEAEIHFTNGPLEGLKLIGFAIWERRNGSGKNVTFPARQYSVNGERRAYALLRPIIDSTAQNKIRDLILEAYAECEARTEADRRDPILMHFAGEQPSAQDIQVPEATTAQATPEPDQACTCPMYPVVISANCPIPTHQAMKQQTTIVAAGTLPRAKETPHHQPEGFTNGRRTYGFCPRCKHYGSDCHCTPEQLTQDPHQAPEPVAPRFDF